MSETHSDIEVSFENARFYTGKDGCTLIQLKDGVVYEAIWVGGDALVRDNKMMRLRAVMMVCGPYASFEEARRRAKNNKAKYRRERMRFKPKGRGGSNL